MTASKWLPAIVGLPITGVIGAIVFGSAGRIDLPFVWACLGLQGLFCIAAGLVLSADLMRERFRPPAEGRVRDYHRAMVMPLLIGSWIVTGLDLGRFHWSDTIPPAVKVIGLAGEAIGLALTLWAMATNRFYSSVIRLQLDRGQHPVTGGPYRFIRHPGYAGTIAAMGFGSLALGSWIGMAPMAGIALLFVRRAVMEDRMLRRELAGYEDYAGRVRWRLIPRIW